MLPGWFGAMFFGIAPATTLRFRPDILHVIVHRGGIDVPEAILHGPVEGLAAQPSCAVDAELPENLFLRRELNLPDAALKSLSRAAELDLVRRTPFHPTTVHSGLGPAVRSGGRVTVAQWVARRRDIDILAERLGALGLRLRHVVVAGQGVVVADRSAALSRSARRWRRANGSLALISLLLAAALWLGPAVQARDKLRDGESDLASLRAEAVALRQEVEALRARETERSAFVDAVIRRPRLAEALRELTVALPDEAWVSEFTFSGERVVLAGQISGSAADLVLALAKSRAFSDPRLTGPVSRTADGNERFEMSLLFGAAP